MINAVWDYRDEKCDFQYGKFEEVKAMAKKKGVKGGKKKNKGGLKKGRDY